MFSEKAENSADVLIFRPTTSLSGGVLDFRPSIAIFQRNCFLFRRSFYSAAELSNLPEAPSTARWKFEFSRGKVNLRRKPSLFSRRFEFSAAKLILRGAFPLFRLRFRISGGTPTVRLKI
jgi:hypothetical protein